MKSERRHELDTNLLAIRVKEWVEKIRPYSRILTVLLIVVIGGAIVSTYIAGSANAERERAWGEFTYALTSYPPQVEMLRVAAQDYPGTPMEGWSNLTWADYQMASASGRFFRNRAEAEKQIKSALAIYESLSDLSGEANDTSELLRDRAKLGMARAFELRGDLEKARESYEQVGGVFGRIAQARSLALAEPDAEDRLAWLATAVATAPKPPVGPGTPGEKPLFGTDFSPAPPEDPADRYGPPETDATQPTTDAESADESPLDFSFDEPEPEAEPDAVPAANPEAKQEEEPDADTADAAEESE